MALQEIRVPDLEDSKDLAIVEVYIKPGETIEVESPLISLESDKAIMDVPSPINGTIVELKVSEGDLVNTGNLIATAETRDSSDTEEAVKQEPESKPAPSQKRDIEDSNPAPDEPAISQSVRTANQKNVESVSKPLSEPNPEYSDGSRKFHATPSLRALARELEVNLAAVQGTGPKNRITREDLTNFVKQVMRSSASQIKYEGAFSLPPIPSEDFSQYGEIEENPLSRIKQISGSHLHKNWMGIPHVTQFEEADITNFETFRQNINTERVKKGTFKISPLIFIIKATVRALQEFENFNSSLASDGKTLVKKKYYNIGIAVDTPNGLLVPVLKNANTKGVFELAREVSELSTRAQQGKMKSSDSRGASFTISSLGGIGGTYFTPIVNAPESAILGLSRSSMKPLWNGSEFKPRLILPFSVSYDHRVIDGAEAARFVVYLASLISDIRRTIL